MEVAVSLDLGIGDASLLVGDELLKKLCWQNDIEVKEADEKERGVMRVACLLTGPRLLSVRE